jgi:hypothetical protein
MQDAFSQLYLGAFSAAPKTGLCGGSAAYAADGHLRWPRPSNPLRTNRRHKTWKKGAADYAHHAKQNPRNQRTRKLTAKSNNHGSKLEPAKRVLRSVCSWAQARIRKAGLRSAYAMWICDQSFAVSRHPRKWRARSRHGSKRAWFATALSYSGSFRRKLSYGTRRGSRRRVCAVHRSHPEGRPLPTVLAGRLVPPRVLPRLPPVFASFSPNFPAHTPDPAAVSANRGGKTPVLRLRRNRLDTPLPRPRLAENLRPGKKPVSPLSDAVSRVMRRRGGVNRAAEGV